MAAITPDILGRLLDEHGAALVLFARQWCDSPEDVVQDALLKLASVTKRPRKPVAWLYRVVRNRAISVGRSERRRARRESAVARPEHAWFVPSDDRLDARDATDALRALPAEQREVIVARIWGGLTFDEIGRIAGCGRSTAHRRYAAGLDGLRERLGVRWVEQNTIRT